MEDVTEHNCGYAVTHTLHDAYSFIKSLAHRGRDAVGIAAIGDNRIDVIKWAGNTSSFDLVDLTNIFPASRYHTYLAHDRYATKGSKRLLADAHPHVIGGNLEDRGSHQIIRDCEAAIVHNGQVNEEYLTAVDSSQLKTKCDSERVLHFYRAFGEHRLMQDIPGSFSMAIADRRRKEVIVMRDGHGVKPGFIGKKDGKFYVASESIAFRDNGGDFSGDLVPGTIYYLSPEGGLRKEFVVAPQHLSLCQFCPNYIGHEHSVIDGIHVRTFREREGRQLAIEFPRKKGIVTWVPRCPKVAAQGYGAALDLEVIPVFYKMKSERSFQGPDKKERQDSIESNLHTIPGIERVVSGQELVIVEDSIVGGNVARRVKTLTDTLGLRSVIILSYTPPIGIIGADGVPRGCDFGGVDMNSKEREFIARGRTPKQISKELGIDVGYLSLEGMFEVFRSMGRDPKTLCTYCIGGPHPFKDTTELTVRGKRI